jgi:hypothetical protein
VDNHHLVDQVVVDAVQKGDKVRVVPLEARADVPEQLVVKVGGPEVGALMLATDAGVAQASSARGRLGDGDAEK